MSQIWNVDCMGAWNDSRIVDDDGQSLESVAIALSLPTT